MFINKLLAPIKWYEETGNSWAISCDFPSYDLSSIRLKPEYCSAKCQKTPGCTHYYWAQDICYLKKKSDISKANAINNKNNGTLCGLLNPGGNLSFY